MSDVVRVGLVGASAGGSWASMAHVPALRSVDEVELAAVCTSRPESAAAAADAFGVRAYHDVEDLAAQPDIDLIAAVVKVPLHHQVVMPALEAGKHVFSEWPLGANLAEAEDMASLARKRGVVSAVGLQGRQDPALTYIKQLREEDWLGEVLTVQMTMLGSGAGKSDSATAWMGNAANGANLMTIVAGHSLDYLAHCVGPLVEVSASVATQVPQWHLTDTGETVDVDAPDTVALTGLLADGAQLSFHMASVPFNGTGWRMVVHGTKGTLVATTRGLPQITPLTLEGARGDEPLSPLEVPDRLRLAPSVSVGGPSGNIARAYARIAEAIRGGDRFEPDFDHALGLHRLLDAIQRSSDERRAIAVI